MVFLDEVKRLLVPSAKMTREPSGGRRPKRNHERSLLWCVSLGATFFAACSLINSFDDVTPANPDASVGGVGANGGTGGGTAGTGGGI
jgi:hypothetical protein